MKLIICFAIERTGSSLIMDLMKRNSNRIFYQDECFHRQACHGFEESNLKKFSEMYNINASDINSASLIEFIHNNPIKFLEFNKKFVIKDSDYFAFKLFRSHLNSPQIDSILLNYKTKILILKRRPIDIFISYRKAQKINKWNSFDTSNISLEIDYFDFLEWHKNTSEWYKFIEKKLINHNLPFTYLNYEDLINFSFDKTLKIIYESLNLKDEYKNKMFIEPHLRKQDISNYEKKIINWEQFFEKTTKNNFLSKLYSFN